jgi:hypothetical protein
MTTDVDTSVKDAWFCTRAATLASARVIDRKSMPYYRYMDTATSALSPFKPELIEMLQVHPGVVMNKGHLLTQMTLFIGPVNFYWGHDKQCREMNTGDSCFILPYVPHSFTTRDTSVYTAIVAVTFSNYVHEALPQLVHLDSAAIMQAAREYATPHHQVVFSSTEAIASHPEVEDGHGYIVSGPREPVLVNAFTYMYNYGTEDVDVLWNDNTRTLRPGASATFKPFITLGFRCRAGRVAVFHVKGCVNASVMRELAMADPIGAQRMTTEHSAWF